MTPDLLKDCHETILDHVSLLIGQGWTRHQQEEIDSAKALLSRIEETKLDLEQILESHQQEQQRADKAEQTLRDNFAMAALSGLLAKFGDESERTPELAYYWADQMIDERNKADL